MLSYQAGAVLLGPRQIGKTTLARDIADSRDAVYLDLEREDHRAVMADARQYLLSKQGKLVVLDEVQMMPGIFKELRGVIDQNRRDGFREGQFLLLGSASSTLLRQTQEGLTGRVAYLELSPILTTELTDDLTQEQLWLRGGFPDSLLAGSDRTSLQLRSDFIRSYLERDMPLLGINVPMVRMRRFWTMLAHLQGEFLNARKLAEALEVEGKTVRRYIDILVDLMLVRRLQPWTGNVGKRLVKSPKIYVRDSGILHALLGIGNIEDLLSHPVVGRSWEGFVIDHVAAVIPPLAGLYFYRSNSQAGLDLVVDFTSGERWGIEIKRSASARPKSGFYTACDDIKATRRIMVHSGDEDFPLKGDTEALSLRSLVEQVGALS